jgi:hypothetical protein
MLGEQIVIQDQLFVSLDTPVHFRKIFLWVEYIVINGHQQTQTQTLKKKKT